MNSAQILQHNAQVETRELDGELFLARPDVSGAYHLNEMGCALWRLFETGCSAAQAKEILCTAFPEAAPAQIERDINALVGDLKAHNLLEEQPSSLDAPKE